MLAALVEFLCFLAVPLILFIAYTENGSRPRARSKKAVATVSAADKQASTTSTGVAPPVVHGAPVDAGNGIVKTTSTITTTTTTTARAAAAVATKETEPSGVPRTGVQPKILIAYASNSQNALTLSHKLFNAVDSQLRAIEAARAMDASGSQASPAAVTPLVKVLELREEDSHACSLDTLLEANPHSPNYFSLIIFVVSTFTDGAAPPRSQAFEAVLRDAFEDHRVPRDALSSKRFAMFGLGDVAYGDKKFNAFAKHVVSYCRGLGAPHFIVPPVYATEAKVSNLFQVFSLTLQKWLERAEFLDDGGVRVQKKRAPPAGKQKADGNGCCSSDAGGKASPCGCKSASGTEANINVSSDEDAGAGDGAGDSEFDEIEDLIDQDVADDAKSGPRELITPGLRKNLEKQGYKLVGTHSGVKLCRWTKAMLRGRGGCYKHTFYNINSSQCMELTPSLACANKCVFCWRRHTNPVSTTFRWKVDDPVDIVNGGLERHVKMIRTMRGVPGVTEEALARACTVRHCALSLVGEPIMYPRINEFLHLLHGEGRRISSFMVTNAQFPEQLRMLRPVTQLYLSIDAPTPEELKQIDRPLFEDYWERCISCVNVLARKRNTRTVFRLTLVNEMNNTNIASYADLVEQGWPDFIEVKGVTFCGTSESNTINMKTNVPRHDEVIDFCTKLCAEIARRKPNYVTTTMNDAAAESGSGAGGEQDFTVIIPEEERNRPYHIACEHEHSCCVLIALDKFYFNQRWNTWIDYDKFFLLAAKYDEVNGAPPAPSAADTDSGVITDEVRRSELTSGAVQRVNEGEERFTFTALDYCAPTPSWAVYRSAERGFDPAQTRVVRKNARPVAPA